MDNTNSQRILSEISMHVYRIEALLYIDSDSDSNEIKLNLVKAKDHLQNVIDLISA